MPIVYSQRAPVEAPANEVRHISRRHSQVQQPETNPGKRDPEWRAEQADEHRLGQELPDDAPAAGAESGPDGDLAMPDRCARQQQVGHVGACDEQHERDRTHHREQHQLDLVGQQPLTQRSRTGSPVLVLGRIGPGQPGGYEREVAARLVDGDSRLHPGKDLRPALIAPSRFTIGREGHPQPVSFRERKTGRHDADHRVRPAVD